MSDDILDPYDEVHYQSIEDFAHMLRTLDYGVEIVEGNKVIIRLPIGIHPYRAYSLASYVNEAMLHGLFMMELFNQDDEDLLELELSADIPLYKRVTLPIDYFHVIEGINRIGLRVDLDDKAGIELTSLLMALSFVYVDVAGQEGPLDALLEGLEELYPKDFEMLEAASDDSYPELLSKHWLDYFDKEFDMAQNLPDDHLIVYCLGAHNRGYVGDKMYFLIDKQVFETLDIPATFFVGDN